MQNSMIFNKIVKILAHYGIEANIIKPNASLSKDLGMDSLDYVELTMEMELAFDLDIPTDRSEKVDTVEDLVTLVEELKKEQLAVS
ncbi:MAG: acyl carrier protein [Bacteroidota bacterium]